ncbi:MAG: type II toxin-antitoxin system YafQ family toxin [Hydrogenoanaerobacterium sp.]
MYTVKPTVRFKRDLKIAARRGYDINLLTDVIEILASGSSLPEKYKAHYLSGNWVNHQECHITPDWLLIYKIDADILVLTLTRTGSHNDLF